jgi:NAD(P)-dependent dehydrogenase (short-subunit alcohol dehydrogenase family)
MSRVFITGSADGLGQHAARTLAAGGHEVVLHARSQSRARDAAAAVPEASAVLVGDLSRLADVRELAEQANRSGRFDAVIHNAGIGYREPRRELTEDGAERVFAINVLAPYVLTALMHRPARLVYLSSGLHRGGDPDLDDLRRDAGGGLDDRRRQRRPWNGSQAYADSKLWDAVLAAAVARRWSDVSANTVEPGWIATRMGGPGAPGSLDEGVDTMCWLAVSDEPEALASGRYLYRRAPRDHHPAIDDSAIGEGLLEVCAEWSGVTL